MKLCFIIGLVTCLLLLGSASCDRLQDEINNLKSHFDTSSHEVADGGPLFLNMLEKWKGSPESGIVFHRILLWYENFFKNIKGAPGKNKELDISNIGNLISKWIVEDRYKPVELKYDLDKLDNIQWNKQLVQRKAVLELEMLLPRMNVNGRRRRRSNMGGRRRSRT
ncbi:interferon gamma isoform X2 [Callorhinchus milii]|uniref:interferon gamma isoform X2 n=1 Tax=Callorhinchus milii TaxID=7868 RepID=UPI0004572336|nr:interferon gamma isoform X2 [Callorhinchus milii]|eukprot:gi/632973500/ref/XP_007903185.1/ PREDICTED: interferon gamma [Callorhinchus milii]